ncbi:MAG: hypothetical protein GEU86_16295 [Actinophytocola sp.]|nr:hypothetical protein [Actinophytocola sp.]
MVRQLSTQEAAALADLASIFDDLQTVLRCCERLLGELRAAEQAEPDDLVLEAVWTTAVLSYTRCFADSDHGERLAETDVTATALQGDVLAWHRVLVQLRRHYADVDNPRERFAVGTTLDADGTPNGIAVTSAPQPRLDDVTIRQTGALAYELSKIVNQRIDACQAQVLATASTMPAADLAKLPRIDVAVSI